MLKYRALLVAVSLTALALSPVSGAGGDTPAVSPSCWDELLRFRSDKAILDAVPALVRQGQGSLSDAANRRQLSRTLYLIGYAFEQDQNSEAAFATLAQALGLDPLNSGARFSLIQAARHADHWQDIATAVGAVEPEADKDALAAKIVGYWAHTRNDRPAAMKYLSKAVSLCPDDAYCHWLLAQTLQNLNRPREADQEYEKCAQAERSTYVKELMLASLMQRHNDTASAREHYIRAGSILPNDPTWHLKMAFLSDSGKNGASSESEFVKAAECRRFSTNVLAQMALFYAAHDRMQQADRCLDYAEQHRQHSTEIPLVRATLLEFRRDYAAAEKEYLKSINGNPYNIWSYIDLAKMYQSQNEPGKSEALLKQATRICPNLWLPWSALGDSLRRDSKYLDAADAYNTALVLSPKVDRSSPHFTGSAGLAQIHAGLAVALVRLDRFAEAQSQAQQFNELKPLTQPSNSLEWVKLRPDRLNFNHPPGSQELSVAMHTAVADSLYETNDLDSCCDEYRKAIKLQPDNPELHMYLFSALLKKKDWLAAMREDVVLANKLVGRAPQTVSHWAKKLNRGQDQAVKDLSQNTASRNDSRAHQATTRSE